MIQLIKCWVCLLSCGHFKTFYEEPKRDEVTECRECTSKLHRTTTATVVTVQEMEKCA